MHCSVMRIGVFVLLVLCISSLPSQSQGVPGAITYQGRLTDTSGNPVPDGTQKVQFKLYEVETAGTSFWDSAILDVQTENGFFTSALKPILPTDISGKKDIWLETWTGNPLAALAPRVKIASVPFALRSGDLTIPFQGNADDTAPAFWIANAGGGAIRGTTDATGDVTAGEFLATNSGCTGSALLGRTSGGGTAVRGTVSSSGTGMVGRFENLNSSNTSDALYGYTAGSGYGVHGESESGTAGFFEIHNSENAADALFARTDGSGAAVYGYHTGTGVAGRFEITNPGSNAEAVAVWNLGSGDAVMAVSNGDEALDGSAYGAGNAVKGVNHGTGRAGYFRVMNSASISPALEVQTYGMGKAALIDLDNAASTATALSVQSNGGIAVEGYTTGGNRAGSFTVSNSDSHAAALYAETNGLSGRAFYANHAYYGNYAYLGTESTGVHAYSVTSESKGVHGTSEGDAGYGVYGNASGSNSYGIYGRSTGASGVGVYGRGGSGGYAAVFCGNVLIQNGTTEASVMELGTGLDYAEGFDVSEESRVEPGTVMIIDSSRPGRLAVSSAPYDKRVAGIVAGAKEMASGVRLGAGRFDCDVALAGRVYCNVDATCAAVEPGDLLTTASTPGYAMKAADPTKSYGAILGKAMEDLGKGRKGQILVLVTLQ